MFGRRGLSEDISPSLKVAWYVLPIQKSIRILTTIAVVKAQIVFFCQPLGVLKRFTIHFLKILA